MSRSQETLPSSLWAQNPRDDRALLCPIWELLFESTRDLLPSQFPRQSHKPSPDSLRRMTSIDTDLQQATSVMLAYSFFAHSLLPPVVTTARFRMCLSMTIPCSNPSRSISEKTSPPECTTPTMVPLVFNIPGEFPP